MNRILAIAAIGGATWLTLDAPALNIEPAQCVARGPTPLRTPVAAAERAAVPLATRGQAFISVASSGSVVILDLATGERTTLDAGVDGPHEVAVSPDGRVLAWNEGYGVHLLDLEAGKTLHTAGNATGVRSLWFARDGRTLTSLGLDGSVRSWEAGTGKESGEVRLAPSPFAVLSPDGKTLAAAGPGRGTAVLADAATGAVLHTLGTVTPEDGGPGRGFPDRGRSRSVPAGPASPPGSAASSTRTSHAGSVSNPSRRNAVACASAGSPSRRASTGRRADAPVDARASPPTSTATMTAKKVAQSSLNRGAIRCANDGVIASGDVSAPSADPLTGR